MICKNCKSEMRLDDRDPWATYTDYYYLCDICEISCVLRKDKSKKIISEDWCDEMGKYEE